MTQGIYISAMTPLSGKTLVALGLTDTMFQRTDALGFFRPVFDGAAPEDDPVLQLMKRTFDLPDSRCRGAVSLERTREILASGEHDELDSEAMAVYSEMARECDVIVVDGTDLVAHNAVTAEFDLNARLANNMGCSVAAVISAHESGQVKDVLNAIDVTRTELRQAGCDIYAVIVNRADPAQAEQIRQQAKPGNHNLPAYVIPEIPAISNPTVAELVDAHGYGAAVNASSLDRDIKAVKVAAMTAGNFLDQITDGDLVITPGDRTDVVSATLASSLAPTLPVPAGMLLTGGFRPAGAVGSLLGAAPFPVLTTERDTFTTAQAVASTRGTLAGAHSRKIAAARGAWAEHVDSDELSGRLTLPRPVRRTPLRFLHQLVERARSERKRIVLPEGEDLRILRAAEIISRRGICDLVILGNTHEVRELAASHGIDLDGIPITDLEKRRTLVLSIAIGDGSLLLIRGILGKTGKGWSSFMAKDVSASSLKILNSALLKKFMLKAGTKHGLVTIGKIAPFGIGAVLGASGNRVIGRKLINNARTILGPPPPRWR